MEKFTEEQQQKIIQALTSKGASNPICPMCRNTKFEILQNYFNNVYQPNLKTVTLTGPCVPTIGVACNKCGFISQHSLGALGLLPNQGGNNGSE